MPENIFHGLELKLKTDFNKKYTLAYPTDLTVAQRVYITEKFPEILLTKSKLDIFHIMDAVFYVVKTGCQWKMLLQDFPGWRTCYNFFRKWTDTDVFSCMMQSLVGIVRESCGKDSSPTVGVIDSQSVRCGLPQSQKGVYGGKKIKGIKRHICVDSNGFPLSVATTTANVHDSKAAYELLAGVAAKFHSINKIKADKGYRGRLVELLDHTLDISLECVKSNFGTSEFRPIDGRWVVERTFAWLDNFRRLCRNYEQWLYTAKGMVQIACVMFMLKFIT